MNNFPEKENKNVEQEEFSTVFSNPEEHKQIKMKSGNKKRLKTVAISLLAVIILVSGTFAAVKFIPEKEEESTNPSIEKIEVLKTDVNKFKTVNIKNTNGEFKFYSVVTKAEGEDTTDKVDWYMEGYEKEVVSSDSIASIVGSLGEISAIREITTKTLADCGLEKSQITADIVTDDGGAFSILIGNKSPDNSGIYLKLSTKDTIYLVNNNLDTTLTFEALQLANSDALSGVKLSGEYGDYTSDGKLTTFDTITLSSINFNNKIVIKPNKDESTNSFMPYLVTSPQNRTANGVDKLLALFADGISVIGAYSFDVSPNTLSKFGLNNPDFTATVKVKDFEFTYKFKLQSDGNYAVVNDNSLQIKKMAVSTLEFLNYSQTDFYVDWVFIESIDNISNLTVKLGNKTYSINVEANPDESDEENMFIVSCNGKSLNSSQFQTFFRYCITLSCSDYTTQNLNTEDEGALIYTYKDSKIPPVEVTFKKASATKYQYSLNGTPMGKINSSDFRKIDKYLQQLLDGKTVTFN